MRKTTIGVLCMALCLMPLAEVLAEIGSSPGLILTGKVSARDTVTVYAPFGGTVQDFTVSEGDRVDAGEALLALGTGTVYAPCDGVVRGIFAEPGDSAAFIQGRYGALCFIEPEESFQVQSSVSQGYDSVENRFLHIGEAVYLQSANSSERKGVGRIITLDGEDYTAEIVSGNLELRDNVNIYRDERLSQMSRIGRGTVSRVNPVAVTGDGAVLSVLTHEEALVSRGDALFEVVTGALDAMMPQSAVIETPRAGIVASVAVAAGQTVQKNQALLTIYLLDQLELTGTISEMDIQYVKVGEKVRVVFDSIPDASYEGRIRAVSGIGTVSENYTEYNVYIAFTPDEAVLLGMSATAYPVED